MCCSEFILCNMVNIRAANVIPSGIVLVRGERAFIAEAVIDIYKGS